MQLPGKKNWVRILSDVSSGTYTSDIIIKITVLDKRCDIISPFRYHYANYHFLLKVSHKFV